MEKLKQVLNGIGRILKALASLLRFWFSTIMMVYLIYMGALQMIKITELQEQNRELSKYTNAVLQQNRQLDSITVTLVGALDDAEIELDSCRYKNK
jgi:hypothetical protein